MAEYKRLQAGELNRRKAKIRSDTEREAANFLKSTEELLAQSRIDQRCKELDSIVRAQSNKAEFEFVRDHAIWLGLITRDEAAKPSAKHVRVEPCSQTATQTASQVRSRSASVSSESQKCTRSASPPTTSKPADKTSTPVPSSAPMEEDDLTPTASPSVALPPAQRVETTILSSVPECNLVSSMHAPGNEMVDDSIEPTMANPSAPDSGAKPNLSDDVTSHILEVMFTALRQNLAPIIASVEQISNIVDGRTPPRHTTSAKPPSATTLPYPKQTSERADSGGRNGSPQGEENDSGWPSSGVPWNPNPISTQEASGETRAAKDTLGELKLGRKARRTQAVKAANAAIPGSAPPPTDGHIPLQHTRISPMFVQVATANAMKQQDKAQGFRVAASSAQNRKASGTPRRGQAITPQGATEVTIIRYGSINDAAKEGALRARHPVTFVEQAQRALNQLSHHPPVILKGRWSTTSATTGNFVFTLSGTYSPEFVHNICESLCEPFPGECAVVPTEGWTWAQLRQVPIQDDDGLIHSCDDLYNALIANPCFQSVLLTVRPSWIGKPENARSDTACYDKDLQTGFYLFLHVY